MGPELSVGVRFWGKLRVGGGGRKKRIAPKARELSVGRGRRLLAPKAQGIRVEEH